jgi:putative endonuclease
MHIPRSHYYTYIVACADGTYYTGKTYDLERRVKQHNGLLSGGAKYTSQRKPVTLVYYEQCTTNALACQREGYLKQLTHQQKAALIKTTLLLFEKPNN